MARWLALLPATLVAPAVAGPAGIATVLALDGQWWLAFTSLALAPVMMLTMHGMFAYAAAFLPALVFGGALAVAAERAPSLRRKRWWVAAGAVAGFAAGLIFVPWSTMTAGATSAGAACALTYRLILGWSRPQPTAGSG